MSILAVDVGYGDCKVVYGDHNGNISKLFKFPTAVSPVKKNDLITDSRIIEFMDNSWYVGTDALQVQSSSIVGMTDYDSLSTFAPLFILKAIQECCDEVIPEKIVVGLSISQISHSGAYKKRITDFLQMFGMKSEVLCYPQGAIAKVAIDNYSTHFPTPVKEFMGNANFVLCDIGFNTLDICQVINGKTSPNMIRGIEGRGAVVIVEALISEISKQFGINLTIPEGKEALFNKSFRRRGTTYDISSLVTSIRAVYTADLKAIVESEFGAILDKSDSLVIVGGGTYIVDPNDPEVNDGGFIRGPSESAEFYNAIGMYHTAIK